MPGTQLLDLPDELLGAVILELATASDTVLFGLTCKRVYALAAASPVWRRHCLGTWQSWNAQHDFHSKLSRPPLETDWRALYVERVTTDRLALDLFETVLATQQARASRMHDLAVHGSDVQDLLLRLVRETPDEAEDVLARRWHANAILGLISRRKAIDVWSRLQRGEHVELEEALGAYDGFIAGSAPGPEGIKSSLDRIAAAIQEDTPGIDGMTIRQKAVRVADYLQSKNLVGMSNMENYHALRNNFLSLALREDEERRDCLPLQSVAIYCAVARRLDVDASPSNFPRHVHAVISAPPGTTLDGYPRAGDASSESEKDITMYMDPFRQSEEVPCDELHFQLSRIGVPIPDHDSFLGPASTLEMVLRTGRNILVSVEGVRMPGVEDNDSNEPEVPDAELAKYAALWSLFMLGDDDPARASARRRQGTRFLLEQLQTDYPHDVRTFAEVTPHLLQDMPELPLVTELLETLQGADREPKAPNVRAPGVEVMHRVGTYFEHRVYGYRGFIVGWDPRCAAAPEWIMQMRVDDLPRGRNQPFYNVV